MQNGLSRLNKTILLSNFTELNHFLRVGHIPKQPFHIYSNKIAVKQIFDSNRNVFRISKTKILFNYECNETTESGDFIGMLDYKVNPDNIKIECIDIKNSENSDYNDIYLDEDEVFELKKSLIVFVKNLAKEQQKSKIIVDVHHNLRTYNSLYSHAGFQVTNRKSQDNQFWIESEFIVPSSR